MNKQDIISALYGFIAQRPGLDPRAYIQDWRDIEGRKAYQAESRAVTKDRHIAELFLRAVELSGITAQDIIEASKSAYMGRLEITENDRGEIVLDYCTGQYFPTEYRKAVTAVLKSALWAYWRDHCGCDSVTKIKDAARRAFRSRAALAWFY